MISFKKAHQIM